MKRILITTIGRFIYKISIILDVFKARYLESEIREKAAIDPSTKFAARTTISNLQNNRDAIQVGKNGYLGNTSFIVFKNGGKIRIGDFVFLNDNTKIWSMDEIRIGNRVLMSYNVMIIDNNSHPLDMFERHKHCLDKFADVNIDAEKIIIEDDVWIGANCIILKGVRVGQGSIIGAGSVVSKSIPANSSAAGNPAKVIKKL